MVQRLNNIVDEDHAVSYDFRGHLIPITKRNLSSLEIGKGTAKKVFDLYKKLGDEEFDDEANEGTNPIITKMMDEFSEAYGIELEFLYTQEDAHNMSEGLDAGRAYLSVTIVSKEDEGVWEILKRHCPDAFYATWREYEG